MLDGTANPASSLSKLLGRSGAGGIDFMYINNGTTTVDNFEVAIDNIRVERIK